MHKLQLFRVKLIEPAQRSLAFGGPLDRERVLRDAVASKPRAELRATHHWHIGNIFELDGLAEYFALGRTTSTTLELYDVQTGNFVSASVDNAPFTHVVLDYHLQVCAIAHKPRLSPTVVGISRQLARLLKSSPSVRELELEVQIDPLRNPNEFIRDLELAHQVVRFGIDFSLPNPWDVEKDFQQPAQRLLASAHGTSGKTTIVGEDLAREPLIRLAEAAGRSGNDARAVLKMEQGGPKEHRTLFGTRLELTVEEEDDIRAIRGGVLERIRTMYKSLHSRMVRS